MENFRGVTVVGWETGCCLPTFAGLFRTRTPPVFAACLAQDWTKVQRLLDSVTKPTVSKWELQYRDGLRRTALHLVVESDLLSCDLVKNMLDKGYDPNTQDLFGDTALHYAVKRRRLSRSLLKLLLEAKGVDVNAANGKGRTCLHLAASTPKFPRELVHLIIQKGGDVSRKSNSGRTPLNSAVRRSRKLVPILLSHGADPFVRTLNGKNAVDWAKENSRLALQLRLEETRNVIVLCIPYVIRGHSMQTLRAMSSPIPINYAIISAKEERGSDQSDTDDASQVNPQNQLVMNSPLRWGTTLPDILVDELRSKADIVHVTESLEKRPLITLLPPELIRMVRDMLF
jgi:hypothetical protein